MKITKISDIVNVMKSVSRQKTYNQQPWSVDECKFYYMIVCEAIKEVILENGYLRIPGLGTLEMKYKHPKTMFNKQTQEFEDGREYSYLSFKTGETYKRRIKALNTHFIKDGDIDGSSEE